MAAAICVSSVVRNKWSGVCCFRNRFLTRIGDKKYHINLASVGSANNLISNVNNREYRNKSSCLSADTFNILRTCSRYCTVIQCDAGLLEDNKTLLSIGKPSHRQKHAIDTSGIVCQSRSFSSEVGSQKRGFPKLMDFPEIFWPSLIKTIKNWILAKLIITPYFDQEFNMPDFILGSKQALEYVSGCLAKGDFDSLEGVVAEEALQEVKRNISTLSVQQRQMLDITKEDVYFSFPYQIGVMFNDDNKDQQRFVEITMVYHTLRGLKQLREQGQQSSANPGSVSEYKEKIMICNYRFVKEFTKGVESHWVVNIINYFRPVDL